MHAAEIAKKLAGSRDPFRPVGWKPPPPEPPGFGPPRPVQRWDKARERLQLGGLVEIGGEMTGVVKVKGESNTIMVKIGETLDIQYSGFLYKWRITSLSEGALGLQRLSATRIRPTPGGGR